jgi:hypothetical protein
MKKLIDFKFKFDSDLSQEKDIDSFINNDPKSNWNTLGNKTNS